MHPHEQRLPYTHLAQQARSDLDNIRRNSKNDTDRLNRLKETISKNKQLIHNQVSQARTAVANEVLELVNAVIRRGNDIGDFSYENKFNKLNSFSELFGYCGRDKVEAKHTSGA